MILVETIRQSEKGTISRVIVDGKFVCLSLELPWKGNQVNISCVPTGEYPVKLQFSRSFKCYLYELKNVPHRAECKFHRGNYLRNIKGCFATGISEGVDENGNFMVHESAVAFEKFMVAMDARKEDVIKITGRPSI